MPGSGLASHLPGHRETAIPFISDIIDFCAIVFAELCIGNAFLGQGLRWDRACPVSAQMVLTDYLLHHLWTSLAMILTDCHLWEHHLAWVFNTSGQGCLSQWVRAQHDPERSYPGYFLWGADCQVCSSKHLGQIGQSPVEGQPSCFVSSSPRLGLSPLF